VIKKGGIVVAGFLICLVALWIYAEKRNAEAVRPPAGLTSLPAFLNARPQTDKIRRFVHDGKVYLEVIGEPYKGPLSLASGPPVYVFDETGKLVDWSRDIGDAPSFLDKWGNFSNGTFISAEEARQLVKAQDR
jgi:hypothetical protein